MGLYKKIKAYGIELQKIFTCTLLEIEAKFVPKIWRCEYEHLKSDQTEQLLNKLLSLRSFYEGKTYP